MWIFPLLTTVIALFAAGMMLRFFLAFKGPEYLAWLFSFLIIAVASACAFIGSYDGWGEITARIFYLGAIALFTGYMSLGSVYINAPRVIGHVWSAILLAISILIAFVLAGADVDTTLLVSPDAAGWRAIEVSSLMAGIVSALSSVSTLIIVVAAVAGLVYRRAGWEQVLVASGVMLVALAVALARLDDWEWTSAGQAVGILVILFGVLRLTRADLDVIG